MCSKCTFYRNKKLDGLFKKKKRNKLIHRQKQATQLGKANQFQHSREQCMSDFSQVRTKSYFIY